jgi:phage terminase small subunit
MTELSPKQTRFCEEYLIDLNASQAYIRAGYRCTAKTANVESCKLLAKPNIQARVKQLQEEQQQRTEITADRVISELAAIAFTNLSDVCQWDAKQIKLKDSETLTPAQSAAIQSISITPGKYGNSVSVKMQNKDSAIEKLGRYMGLFSDLNSALATLKTYGVALRQRPDGNWEIDYGEA